MANTDRALVVGIAHYPAKEFEPLKGPVTDAEDFYKWVVASDGGDVPVKQVTKILSKPLKKKVSVTSGKPTAEQIEEFFIKLDDVAKNNQKKGNGLTVGRRLYIFLSGHGFALQPGAGLLAANASPSRPKFHVPGMDWANNLYGGLWFEEILLFMDCCRREPTGFIPNPPAFKIAPNADPSKQGKRLYGFAAPHGRLALERNFGQETRGVFSQTLMTGLRGAAGDPATGKITAVSLRSYLFNNMKSFLDPRDLNRAEIAQEPALDPTSAETGPDFVIATVPIKRFPVRVESPAATVGLKINIRDGIWSNGDLQILKTKVASAKPWDFELPMGSYVAEIVGGPPMKGFSVTAGGGRKDVKF